jgi:hypothetical protein
MSSDWTTKTLMVGFILLMVGLISSLISLVWHSPHGPSARAAEPAFIPAAQPSPPPEAYHHRIVRVGGQQYHISSGVDLEWMSSNLCKFTFTTDEGTKVTVIAASTLIIEDSP